MSLVRGHVAEEQPAGMAVTADDQQLGNFRDTSAAAGADEMEERRPLQQNSLTNCFALTVARHTIRLHVCGISETV